MDLPSIVLVAVGLSMDCFAVAIASGIASKGIGVLGAVKIGVFFGGFQAGMPVLGWYGGLAFVGMISVFDHWIAFMLLALIGGKMILEAVRGEEGDLADPLRLRNLVVASVATSIDSLAVGLSLSLLGVPIIPPAATIGIVCFAISFCGAILGGRAGSIAGGEGEGPGRDHPHRHRGADTSGTPRRFGGVNPCDREGVRRSQ